MKTEVAVILFYKGGGFSSTLGLGTSGFDNLKQELRESYITNFKDTGGPQAGGVFDAVVEISTNEYFKDLTQIVKEGHTRIDKMKLNHVFIC